MDYQLRFDETNRLVLARNDGSLLPLTNPYTSDGHVRPSTTLDGKHVMVGGFIDTANRPGQPATMARVDFLNSQTPTTLNRWRFNLDGQYIGQAPFDLAISPTRQTHNYLLNDDLITSARGAINDYHLYTLLRHTAGPAKAREYINSLAAGHEPTPSSGNDCRMVVIFNHHYGRNCQAIRDFYSSRFSSIDFILPCVAPQHPNFFSYPFGSFQFHGMIYSYLQQRQQAGLLEANPAYLFIQDDLLLHPSISSAGILENLTNGNQAIFHAELPWSVDYKCWQWTERARNSILEQRSSSFGNGFEGLDLALPITRLYHGVSDCFAMSSQIASHFVDLLAPMVAANIFPEVSIPTALFNASMAEEGKVQLRPGRWLWGEDRRQAEDPAFIADFIASNDMFVHPVKLASCKPAIRNLLSQASGS
jgi:hypothetical protein